MRKRVRVKVIIEKHKDGYVGYPIGMKGVVVGQGKSFHDALEDVNSAMRSHFNVFGLNTLQCDDLPEEVFVAEAEVP